MEITPGFIYLVATLENANILLGLLMTAALMGTSLALFTYLNTESKELGIKAFKYAKVFFISLVCALAIKTFLPSGKVLAAMYILPPIANSEAVQEIPSKLTDLAIEWLQELKPNKENDK